MWERRGQRDLRRGAVLGMRGPGLETGLGGGRCVAGRGVTGPLQRSFSATPPSQPGPQPSRRPSPPGLEPGPPARSANFFFPLCKNFFSLLPPARYGSSRSLPSYILPSDRSRR